jgi:hypothetical protein
MKLRPEFMPDEEYMMDSAMDCDRCRLETPDAVTCRGVNTFTHDATRPSRLSAYFSVSSTPISVCLYLLRRAS